MNSNGPGGEGRGGERKRMKGERERGTRGTTPAGSYRSVDSLRL